MCEKWVGLIKDSLRKLKETGDLSRKVSLSWAVAAKNCLYDQKGYSPNQLVFGKNPALPNLMGEFQTPMAEEGNEERMVRENLMAMHRTRILHVQQEADGKIKRALRSQTREHKLEEVAVKDEVLYKRVGEKEWRGPGKVIGVDGKTVIVKHGGSVREIARVHITRVQGLNSRRQGGLQKVLGDSLEDDSKQTNCENDNRNVWVEEENEEEEDNEMEERNLLTREREDREVGEQEREDRRIECPKVKKGDRVKGILKETGDREEWRILGLAGKRSSKKWSDSYNVQDVDTGDRKLIDLREYENIQIIPEEEEILLGFEDDEVLAAKMKELKSWKDNEVYEEEPDEDQRTMSIRWIVTEKREEGKRICKARLVARGFEEKNKEMKTDAPTCSPEILKLCLSVMMMKNWECQTIDIKTAYLQGDVIDRDLYIRPPVETGSKGIWKLKKTIYGLKDAAKAWYEKVKKIVEELGGTKSILDNIVFFWKNKKNELIGIMCAHVDDFCFGGSEEFQKKVIGGLLGKLKIGAREKRDFKYIGVNVRQESEEIWMEQKSYVKSIRIPDVKRFNGDRKLKIAEMKEYRSLIGQLNWVAQHTRPDIGFSVSDMSSSFQEGTTSDMRGLVKLANSVKEREVQIKLERLEEGKERWEVYSDASFGNIGNSQSQMGYIISLIDDEGRKCPIQWKSMRIKRVAKSTIEAEALSLGEAAEAAIYLNKIWEEIVGRQISVVVKTDSKTLESALKATTGVKSRRLRIDIAAVKEMIAVGEVEEIEWVSGKNQVADVLTKRGVGGNNIRQYVSGGTQ